MITPACCSLCCRWCSFWRCWLLPLSVRPSHPGAGGRNRRYGVSESLEQWQRLLGLRLQPALLNTSWSAQEPGDRQQRPWRCRTRSAAGLDRAARSRGHRSLQRSRRPICSCCSGERSPILAKGTAVLDGLHFSHPLDRTSMQVVVPRNHGELLRPQPIRE